MKKVLLIAALLLPLGAFAQAWEANVGRAGADPAPKDPAPKDAKDPKPSGSTDGNPGGHGGKPEKPAIDGKANVSKAAKDFVKTTISLNTPCKGCAPNAGQLGVIIDQLYSAKTEAKAANKHADAAYYTKEHDKYSKQLKLITSPPPLEAPAAVPAKNKETKTQELKGGTIH